MKEVIQLVYFMKATFHNCMIFKQIYSNFRLEHMHLLYHSVLNIKRRA